MVDCVVPTYLPASWKGVPFFCDSSSDEFGRRGALYEYPLSDSPGYKDLGRKARRFKVEGYLLGSDQVAQTQVMAAAAESQEPGTLIHPIYGAQQVACVTLTAAADYRKDKKRTKLSFEFVEANAPAAPFRIGAAISTVFGIGSDAVTAAGLGVVWNPDAGDAAFTLGVSSALGDYIVPASDEESYDAIDMLARGANSQDAAPYPSYASAVDPINYGSATIRRIHDDAVSRLRDFNAALVDATSVASYTPAVQAVALTTRLITIRDYATAVAQATYETVKAALDDLDFIMTVYDEESAIATQTRNDVLVSAIHSARAAAASAILSRNIRLPGIAEFQVDGLWPSVLVAHKLYADATRHQQIERYNPTMAPFWLGRSVVAPAA